MTDKVLSQDEVDALLKGVATGEIDTDEAKDKIVAGVRAYDFTSQERIIRGKMPGLEMINDGLSRLLRNSISSFVTKYIDISIQNVETVKYSDFMRMIPMPSSINIFKMDPLKGYSLFVLEAPLVFAFLEFYFGGTSAQHVKSEGRSFTQIEQRVIRKIVDVVLKDMEEAWKAVTPVKTGYVGSEINPQFVSIVTPAEIVIKIELNVEIEDFTGRMFFCLPYSMIEPIKEKLYSGLHGEKFETDHRWAVVLKEALQDTRVNLTAEMGRVVISFEDLLNFEEGNIINLGVPVTQEFTVKVEGVPKFKGVPGYSRGNQSLKLTKVIE